MSRKSHERSLLLRRARACISLLISACLLLSLIPFVHAVPISVSLNNTWLDKGEILIIYATGGTANGHIMIQIQDDAGVPGWADQRTLDLSGSLIYSLNISLDWGYRGGNPYTVRVKDVGSQTSAWINFTLSALPPPNVPPIANSNGPYSGKTGAQISFSSAGSSDSDGSITEYYWTFGDGGNSTSSSPTHAYSSIGNYTISLLVTDDDGASDIDTSYCIVSSPPPSPPPQPPPPHFPPPVSNKKPVADAGENQTALTGHVAYFDGTGSSDPDGQISTYLWIFGDGKVARTASTSHTYTVAGEYNVSLVVVDNGGSADTDWILVAVEELPIGGEKGVNERVDAGQTDHIVNATDTTDTKLIVNTTKPVTISVFEYPGNPYPEVPLPLNSLPTVVDVFVSNPDAVDWPIYIERKHTISQVVLEREKTNLFIYYYKEGAWHKCRNTGSNHSLGIVWAYMYQDELTGSPLIIVALQEPAAFEVSDLIISPEVAEPSENIEITIDVANIGGEEGNYTVHLKIDGVNESEIVVTLDAGASEKVIFNITREEEGTYDVEVEGITSSFEIARSLSPADFKYDIMGVTPKKVTPGETVSVDVKVENVGEEAGTYSFDLLLDEIVVDTISGELEGGETDLMSLTVSSMVVGTHNLEIIGSLENFAVARALAPAEFEYNIVSVRAQNIVSDDPREVKPGEVVSIDVEVENVGEEAGTYSFDLLLDEIVVDTISGELEGGETDLMSLTVSSDEIGTHTLEARSLLKYSSSSFTVVRTGITSFQVLLVIVILLTVIAAILYANLQGIITLPSWANLRNFFK